MQHIALAATNQRGALQNQTPEENLNLFTAIVTIAVFRMAPYAGNGPLKYV
ncbi:hypothetical protein J3P75_13455 [Pseudomonas sp. R1-1]|uniref:hypothetical protein n=1 Tax=Pseudomonas sp. R1-1 TaxID=1602529 RepID=UPI003DAA1835